MQAIASPSPWVIFPGMIIHTYIQLIIDLFSKDLLRVQTNPKVEDEQDGISDNKNNANNKMPLQFNINSRQNNMSDGSCSGIRGAIGRETGAIPKQRALDPPDVSLLTSNSQVKLPSTLDLCSSTLRTANRDTTLTHSSIPAVRQSLTNERTSNDNSLSQIVQLERDLKAAQTQKAVLQQQLLQKDTQIRELQSQQRQKSSSSIVQDLSVTSLIESMEKFRSNIEGSFRQLEERMNSLETKLPNLIKSAVENKVLVHNSVQLTNDGDAKPNDGDAKPAVVDIHMLLEQQKQVNK